MNIALVHNYYQQPGGEDQVFTAEAHLLESRGHTVHRFTLHNDAVRGIGQLELARKTVWNPDSYKQLRSMFRSARVEVVHVHNTLPLVSPAVYYAAKAEGAVVIQTLHNYRLSCLNGLFFRDGHVCEDCLGKVVPWPGIRHACYRASRPASGVAAAMLTYHKLRGTYSDMVDRYIALTEFSRMKLIQGGLPSEKVIVKPNFLMSDPGKGEGLGNFALFVGRISAEKGLETLLSAWRKVGLRLPLKIAGDGPLSSYVGRAARELTNVDFLGRQPHTRVLELMQHASLLVFPSVWFEGFPMTLLEALAIGLPVVASRLGNMQSLVDHGITGLHFMPGNASELAEAINWMIDHPDAVAQMRQRARFKYESKYTAAKNYEQLIAIYQQALG